MSKPVIPIRFGTCPTAMLMAEPVMKAEIAVKEMKSTIQPQRARPMKEMMAPATIARAEATTWPGISGLVSWTLSTIFPTKVDMTATGPIVISFEVAKNQ